MNPLVSIIIPIYNSENTIKRCVESVLSQTYLNFEVLLIDDGSIDASSVISDGFAKFDDRVKVYHKKNGGVSSARNLGLLKAKGDYITFVDSDDWVEPNYLEAFGSMSNIDFVASYYVAEGWQEWVSCPFENKEYTLNNLYSFYSKDFNKMNFICGKLFKRQIIDAYKIRFDEELSYGEDTLFIYTFLRYATSVRTRGDATYHYICYNDSSLSHAPTPWHKYENSINALCCLLEKMGKERSWDVYHSISYVVINHFNRFIREIQVDYKIMAGVAALRESLKNKYVVHQVKDTITYSKSLARCVFDWLVLHKMCWVAVLLMKLTYKGK